jgi:hypothetical protein
VQNVQRVNVRVPGPLRLPSSSVNGIMGLYIAFNPRKAEKSGGYVLVGKEVYFGKSIHTF